MLGSTDLCFCLLVFDIENGQISSNHNEVYKWHFLLNPEFWNESLFLIPNIAKENLHTINELSAPWKETFRFLFNLELTIKLDYILNLNKSKTTVVQKFKCIGTHDMTKWLRNKEILTIQL